MNKFVIWLCKIKQFFENYELTYNENQTKKILNIALPKMFEYKSNGMWIYKTIFSWWLPLEIRSNVPIWHKKYCEVFEKEIMDYLINDYQIEGYNKTVDGKWIKFTVK